MDKNDLVTAKTTGVTTRRASDIGDLPFVSKISTQYTRLYSMHPTVIFLQVVLPAYDVTRVPL